MSETREFQERAGQVEKLIQKLESAADPALRAAARELVQCLMDLHGTGIERIFEIVSTHGQAAPGLLAALGRDPLVSSLLVLYDLHPEDFETRVRRGLDQVRPFLRTRDARLEILEVRGGAVRVRIVGPASNDLQAAVRDALFETAPDALEVVVEGGDVHDSGFVPLASLLNGSLVATTQS